MDKNIHKIQKYLYKTNLNINDIFKTKKYLIHLKYHIQKGGENNAEVIEKIDKIIQKINNNPELYQYNYFDIIQISKESKDLRDENYEYKEQLNEIIKHFTLELENYKNKIKNLKLEIFELSK